MCSLAVSAASEVFICCSVASFSILFSFCLFISVRSFNVNILLYNHLIAYCLPKVVKIGWCVSKLQQAKGMTFLRHNVLPSFVWLRPRHTGQHWQPTLTADNVGLCIAGTNTDGRHGRTTWQTVISEKTTFVIYDATSDVNSLPTDLLKVSESLRKIFYSLFRVGCRATLTVRHVALLLAEDVGVV